MINRYKILLLVFMATMVLGACDRDRNTTGWDYAPDMYYSDAYETYKPNKNFKDGKTQQASVEGTVPRDFEPYLFTKTEEDRLLAGKEMLNPLQAGACVMKKGKEQYAIFCSNCHGDFGDGKGNLYTSGKYAYPPASLITEKMKKAPDGEFYHVIMVGHGIMSPHGYMIEKENRWAIVKYIKEELQKK
ncbi:hypothetical protein EMN47_15295 [Prolixibacteraceae bacterium JC049]|nr:hypothetical protein [Prolixibacteraceae bacterium JC049]